MPAGPARRSAPRRRRASRAARKSPSTSGQPVKLGQPLDWVAITDHSDGMGVITEIKGGNPEMMADPTLKRWHDMFAAGAGGGEEGRDGTDRRAVEQEAAAARHGSEVRQERLAEEHRDRREVQRAGALHRVHRLRVDVERRRRRQPAPERHLPRRQGQGRQVLPYTTFQSENPEDLWKWMAEWEKTTGGKMLAIPHNGNLSNGRMFALTTFGGDPLTKAWAEERQRWEPLFEAIQMKGQSESHPSLSTTDEFARNYELWDRGNLVLTPKKPGHDPARVRARSAEERPEGRTGPRHQPVQVRDGRRHRHAQRPARPPRRTTSSRSSRAPSRGRIAGTRTR